MRKLLILICLLLTACGREPLYQSQGYVFGTLVDISIYGVEETRARQAADAVLKDFQRLHQKLHAWDENSELSKLNAAFAEGKPRQIDAEMAAIIQHATTLSVQSKGAFNPAIGRLIQQWGFQRNEFSPITIDADAIADLARQNPQMSDIVIEQNDTGTGFLAQSKNPAVKLDLGGYAKGYALDRAAGYLRSEGIEHALVNIGGNIIALGQRGKQHWRIGIQHPRQPGAIATLELKDGWAIGTSGDYQRYFELDGMRYCHIIDPKSGYPVQHTRSVSVLIPPGEFAGTLSDAVSKPVFIAGTETRLAVADTMGVNAFMVIDADGKVFMSEAMARDIQWNQEQHGQFEILH
ncbi:FAD:protein FMN transferase [Methylophilaceae bacterium]|nr:FAD:protein FMN transferase [Methylophilaceae bacterium]